MAMDGHHGNTWAAWATVTVAFVGSVVAGVALVLDFNWVMFAVGMVIIAISPLVGLALSKAGLGAKH